MNGNDNSPILEAIDPDVNLFLNVDSCNYYTVANYINEFPKSNQFSILNQNVQSFHSKKPQLEALIAATNHSFHALVLSETWNSADNLNLCNIDGYNVVHSYRSTPAPSRGGIGGGVSIFVDCNLYKLKNLTIYPTVTILLKPARHKYFPRTLLTKRTILLWEYIDRILTQLRTSFYHYNNSYPTFLYRIKLLF